MTTEERQQALETYEVVYNEFSNACDKLLNHVKDLRKKYGYMTTSPYCISRAVERAERSEYYRLQIARTEAENNAIDAWNDLRLWEA